MDSDFDLESLVNLEQTFYDSGYKDGFDHGRIHGLIDGRALGREKGFEMWEELGFYEGFALTWQAIYTKQGRDDDRAVHHIQHLLDLIAQFPTSNPSASEPSDLDIPKLLRQIRSRYKILCSTLGVKHSLRAAGDTGGSSQSDVGDFEPPDGAHKEPVWKLENDTRRTTGQGLNF